jgi:RHS repeat-associated protein
MPLVAIGMMGLAAVAGRAQSQVILEPNDDSMVANPVALGRSRVSDFRVPTLLRGVRLDGALARSGLIPMSVAANPGAGRWDANAAMGDVDLASGAYTPTDVDISLPAPGFSWPIGRSYGALNDDTDPNANSPQGYNWMQSSQAEIVFIDQSDNTKDTVRLMYGASAYAEFVRGSSTNNEFKGVNGASGVFKYVAGSPDTWTYYDVSGTKAVFFGGNTASNAANWQVWKYIDAAGNTAYVGDKDTATTAVSNGYDSSGRILLAYDSADRRYTYTYSTIDSAARLTQVKAETRAGGTWASPTGLATVGQVDYAYYRSGDTTYGDSGCLKMVTITTPLSDPAQSLVRKKLYRYYTGSYNGSSNPGNPKQLKMVVGFEGVRSYDWSVDATLDDDQLTASTDTLKSYSDAYLEYDSSRRVSKAFFNGECGCSGGVNGSFELSYGTNSGFSNTSSYDTAWKYRTVTKRPDSTYSTQYFDEVGQPLGKVVTNTDPAGSPTETWASNLARNSGGAVTSATTPANSSGYTHSTGAFSSSSSGGLINNNSLIGVGGLTNFSDGGTYQSAGTGSTAQYTSKDSLTTRDFLVTSGGSVTVQRPQLDWTRAMHTATTDPNDSAKYDQTTYSYVYWSSTNTDPLYVAPKSVTTTRPVVTTATNGSNAANTETAYYRKDGTTAFSRAADGTYSYTQYTNGLLTKSIRDAQTNNGSDFASGDDPSTDFGITETGDGLRLVTTYTYDAQGRHDTTTEPDGHISKSYFAKLTDGRLVQLSIPRVEVGGSTTYYGPVSYRVFNHAGQTDFAGQIKLSGGASTIALGSWIGSTADPLTALSGSVGSVSRMSTSVYSNDGHKLLESRSYFSIPASGAGSVGTNYDATAYGYDDMGRTRRVKDATGTITRTVFDTLGRAKEQWLGTNDASFAGGESVGVDNMVKVSETVYDGGSAGGNSLVTTTRQFVQDNSTGQRESSYIYDGRNRVIVSVSPQAPHTVTKYDNLSRVVAMGQFSSSSGLSASTDPTATTTNRVGLSETAYDSNGRAWKSIRHKINQTTGADEDTLIDVTWVDSVGRVVKAKGQSGISKTVYDRLGRATKRFTLASDNDSTYADASGVSGDKVLVESQTQYENTTGLALMQATISRYQDDTSGTGALDSNADADDTTLTAANITGWLSISVAYYDGWHRRIDTVLYGNAAINNGSGSAFTRPGSPAARSDTALRITNTYNDDGTIKEVQDPKGLITRYAYDEAGRKTSVTENYTDGTPGGGANDDQDRVTKYEYTNGLKTKLIADLAGSSDDQTTIYTYGVTKGASLPNSKISSNMLLASVQYPDSSGGSDLVTYAYNAKGQQIATTDQLGTVTETTYDTAGRATDKRLTTVAGSLDSSVRRISTAFDSRGMISTVTQYDNAAVGSGSVIDQVKYTYDGWGNTTLFEQDRDSAVSGGGNQYSVAYSLSKNAPTNGATMLRRSTMTLPDGSTLTYGYGAANSIADDMSRVDSLTLGAVQVASYAYLGSGQLVGTALPDPNVSANMYAPGAVRDYGRLDRFGRVISSRWDNTGGSDTAFYRVDLAYDRNSDITLAEDKIQTGGTSTQVFSAQYSMDDLNRLTRAEEGNWNGSAITSRSRDERWTLSLTGNWSRRKLDLNGDGAFSGSGELDDSGTFNKANEWLTRDTDTNGSTNFTLTHDAAGQMTDDGQNYTWKHDGFGRLKEVRNRSNSALVAEYRYNGLGYRIGWHYDAEIDGDVDANDPWYYFAYDERWRPVATFRGSDSSAKEKFVYHAAGLRGMGGSSYIDTVVLRDRDANSGWTSAADGTLEERVYYAQNWRGDVSVVLQANPEGGINILEWVKYSAYGTPWTISAGDYNRDGVLTSADATAFQADYDTDNLRADVNFDGATDFADFLYFYIQYDTAEGGGRNAQSRTSVANRIGYAGYQWDPAIRSYHVRHRVLVPELGRWTRRDPIGYVDGVDLYEYVGGHATISTDSLGLRITPQPLPETSLADSSSIGNVAGGTPSDPSVVFISPGDLQCNNARPSRMSNRCSFLYGCPCGVEPTGVAPSSNGCGNGCWSYLGVSISVFATTFLPCCNGHDICFTTCDTFARGNSSHCDRQFYDCAIRQCDLKYTFPGSLLSCYAQAGLWYDAVYMLGNGDYCASQATACKCKPCIRYAPNPPLGIGDDRVLEH